MTPPIQEAFELLLVGMATVALVLGLVVLAGRLLIYAVNRTASSNSGKNRPLTTSAKIDPAIVAVLTAAVEATTQGQGTIQKIDPL